MGCRVSGCDRPLYARELCQPQYKRLRRHGDVYAEIPIGRSLKPCSVEGCPNDLEARGYRHGHSPGRGRTAMSSTTCRSAP